MAVYALGSLTCMKLCNTMVLFDNRYLLVREV